jgi:hypothetical protein
MHHLLAQQVLQIVRVKQVEVLLISTLWFQPQANTR